MFYYYYFSLENDGEVHLGSRKEENPKRWSECWSSEKNPQENH